MAVSSPGTDSVEHGDPDSDFSDSDMKTVIDSEDQSELPADIIIGAPPKPLVPPVPVRPASMQPPVTLVQQKP